MYEIELWIADLITTMLFMAVGLKLWNLSNRTGESAERILGIAILSWGLSYVVYDIPYLLLAGDERFEPVISLMSYVVADLGNFAFAVFTWVVFRRSEPWALGLVVIIGAAIIIGWVGSVVMSDFGFLGNNGSPFHWLGRNSAFLTSAWMAFEATNQYAAARRRRKLGLCDPITCNRYLLWGTAASLWVIMDLGTAAYLLADDESGIRAIFSSVFHSEALFGTLGAFLIGLAFFPPASYERWLRRDETAEAA